MRHIPVATSGTIFWAPMTRITCPAPDASGPSWLPLAEAMSSDLLICLSRAGSTEDEPAVGTQLLSGDRRDVMQTVDVHYGIGAHD
jgi:hypothetical protein